LLDKGVPLLDAGFDILVLDCHFSSGKFGEGFAFESLCLSWRCRTAFFWGLDFSEEQDLVLWRSGCFIVRVRKTVLGRGVYEWTPDGAQL
jgi:hypothetical protein